MAVGAHLLIFEIDLPTLWAFHDFTSDGYAAVGTCRSFVADLPSTFGTFYDSHNKSIFSFNVKIQSDARLSVSEPDFPELVLSHEPALVDISVDAIEMSFTSVLPHDIVEIVLEHRSPLCVLGDHHFVVSQPSKEVVVIEIGSCVNKRLLFIGLFH